MRKLILCMGISGSGKTTYAKQWAEEDPTHRIRLNYDDIRCMLGKYWVPERENLVKEIFNKSLEYAMFMDYDIIIDNMSNLNPKHRKEYQDIVKNYNDSNQNTQYEIELKLFDTPVKTCIERDSKRESPIGEKIIKEQWKKYRNYIIQQSIERMLSELAVQNSTLPKAIIVDMDATLCFNTNGRPFYGDGAAEGMLHDIPNDPIVDLASNYSKLGYKLIILTGRDETCRIATEKWLEDMCIFPDELIMRPVNDFRPGNEMKKYLFERYIKDKYRIEFVIDDSSECVQMWRDLGFVCLQPNEGKF